MDRYAIYYGYYTYIDGVYERRVPMNVFCGKCYKPKDKSWFSSIKNEDVCNCKNL